MEGHTYTQCSIEVNLSESIWDLLNGFEAMENPPKAVGVCVDVDDETGKVEVTYVNYRGAETEELHDNIVAVIAVEAGVDDATSMEELDPELKKAMQFMYFYQAVHTVVEKLELDI